MTLEEQLRAEREARIRAEGERDGFAKAMEILASRLGADPAAERRRAYDRSRKSRVSTGIPPDSTGISPPSSPPFPSPFPPSPEPSSPYPLSFPPSSPSPSASQETAVAAPASDFELTSPSASKPPRKPSAAERLYAAMQQLRRERCDEVGETFVIEHWPSARINRDLGPLAKADDATKELFEAAWGLYLADDGERIREPAWSLSWFMSGGVRARYETRVAREGP